MGRVFLLRKVKVTFSELEMDPKSFSQLVFLVHSLLPLLHPFHGSLLHLHSQLLSCQVPSHTYCSAGVSSLSLLESVLVHGPLLLFTRRSLASRRMRYTLAPQKNVLEMLHQRRKPKRIRCELDMLKLYRVCYRIVK